MPYLEKGYVVARQIGEKPLQSELYAAIRESQQKTTFLQDFIRIVREQGFKNLPGLSAIDG
jgi:LysR family transcriptional regulator for metE and metH